jgi:hypothetical protein
MRNRFGWLAAWVAVGGLLLRGTARAEDGNYGYEVPPPNVLFPWPFGHPRMEEGGLYTAGEFLFLRQTNPMKTQVIAVRGVVDRDGSVTNTLGLTGPSGGPGSFIGSKEPALSTEQVGGPGTFEPGWRATIGWRFRSGIAVEFSWLQLAETRFSATASFQPGTAPGQNLENTFLFSPVFNYPLAYFGPLAEGANGFNLGALSGIWDGADLMTEDFVQRFHQADLLVRYPLQQTECWRCYGLFGFRQVQFWERYRWRTVDANVNGIVVDNFAATYSNVVANNLWGLQLGCGNEWEVSETPIGAFSISLDLRAALFANYVTTQAKYELGDLSTAATRTRKFSKMTPELQAGVALWWYPYEAVQVRLGYDVMAFFNTMAAPNPVDFNYGSLAPPWEDGIVRVLHGCSVGIAFIF